MLLDDSEDDDLQTIVERNDKELAEEKKFEEMYSGELVFEELPLLNKVQKKVGEYVIFKYQEEYFPGKILSLTDEQAEISAMQKSPKSWKWPEKMDIGKYDWEDIIGAIDEPKMIFKRGFSHVKEIQNLQDI